MLNLKFAIFRIVVNFLNKAYLRVQHVDGLILAWIGAVKKRCATRGPVDTIGWIKSVRLAYTRYLSGVPLLDSPGFGVSLDGGLPGPLDELFRDMEPARVRLGMTLLGLSRIIPGWKSPDLAPIIDPPRSAKLSYYGLALSGVVTELGWKLPRPVWTEVHVSTKAGPNAQAMVGAIEDAHLLSDVEISNLRILGGDELVRTIELHRSLSLGAWLDSLGLKPKGMKSKLSLVKDKEAKCRIVAILDYWTQSALKPLHDAEMRFLKSLRSDCTFNQGGFRQCLSRSGPYHSLDLTAATDRVPVAIQEPVLACLVGSSEYAAAWRDACVDREFTTTWGNRSVVRYACGQPMGAYSSWATFAITHHAIVRLAALRAGLSLRWSNYALLGDDIVIASDAVAKEYRTILDDLGVSISEQKTHVSVDTYEFAKRWIQRGTEVTGAPLGSLFEAITFISKKTLDSLGGNVVPTKAIKRVSFYEVATWFRELESRWLPRSYTTVSRGLFASLFLLLGQGSRADRLAQKAWNFYLLPSREDSRTLRAWKTERLGSLHLGGLLGCFSWSRSAVKTVPILLNECKARVLEEAIKNHLGALAGFQLEASKYLKMIPEGLDAQSTLLAVAPFAAVFSNVRLLQLEFDKVREVRGSNDVSHWLQLDVRLFLEPLAALSKRQSKTVAANKATIVNHFTAMCRGIEEIRALALGFVDQHQLATVLMNKTVLPTRGDSKYRKAPTPILLSRADAQEIMDGMETLAD
jgi:hypothetical protein